MKDSFIKSTIILIIGGFLTKILGMVIKIVTTRLIGLEGISLYMLVFPTLSLFTSLAQFSLPISISKLVSENKYNNKNLIFSALPIILIVNLFLILIIIIFSKFISFNLLKDSRCYLPILCIALVLPFEAISNMLRGYMFGKQKMLPHVVSHILEQTIRLILTIMFIPYLLKKSIIYAICFLVGINMISETISIIILLLFIPNDVIIKKEDIIPKKNNIKNILDISIPNTSTRLIGNIGYFLEPIILTSAMLASGYSLKYITLEYGIVSGYTMPMLLLPGFFTGAISSSILPVISNSYSKGDFKNIKRKTKQAIFFSLMIGIPITILFLLFPSVFLKLLYDTTKGSNYLRVLAVPFLLYYIELPLSAVMQATNMSKKVMIDNLMGIILKIIILYLSSLLHIGIYGFIMSCSINIIIVTTMHIIRLKRSLL